MATVQQSWARLRSERWVSQSVFARAVSQAQASVQSMTSGSGTYVYDEYSVLVSKMPAALTAEGFLRMMLLDLNGTVKNSSFDRMNIFKRTRSGGPQIGEIIEIDILGPDNGSVALAEMAADYFIFQTVATPNQGTHPEYGAREFGFERLDGLVNYTTPRACGVAKSPTKFYTRGVSSPANALVGWVGEEPQTASWTGLVEGIAGTIRRRGGATIDGSAARVRQVRAA